VVGADQHLFDDVLDAFDLRDGRPPVAVAQDLDYLGRQQTGLVLVEFSRGLAGQEDGPLDLAGIE